MPIVHEKRAKQEHEQSGLEKGKGTQEKNLHGTKTAMRQTLFESGPRSFFEARAQVPERGGWIGQTCTICIGAAAKSG